MERDELPVLDPNLDYSQVTPIHQKRIVAFVNHFITRTVVMLNNLAQNCDTRFMELDYKLNRMEASLSILEAQLNSVPWLKENEISPEIDENAIKSNENVHNEIIPELPEIVTDDTIDNSASNSDNSNLIKVSQHSNYEKFFKMIQFGVPIQAVKLKMEQEGHDPKLIDDPNMLIPIEN